MGKESMFSVGDIVQLKSGGPEMTVNDQPESIFQSYKCQWFAGKKLEYGHFPHASLNRVEPTKK